MLIAEHADGDVRGDEGRHADVMDVVDDARGPSGPPMPRACRIPWMRLGAGAMAMAHLLLIAVAFVGTSPYVVVGGRYGDMMPAVAMGGSAFTRKAATQQASSWAEELLQNRQAHALYVSALNVGSDVLHLTSAPMGQLDPTDKRICDTASDLRVSPYKADGRCVFCSLDALAGSELYGIAAQGIAALTALLPKDFPRRPLGLGESLPPDPRPNDGGLMARFWDVVVRRGETNDALLRATFEMQAALLRDTDLEESADLQAWADRIGVLESPKLSDVPTEYQRPEPEENWDHYLTVPFIVPKPDVTKPYPLPLPYQSDYRPTCISDCDRPILHDWAHKEMQDWLKILAGNLRRMAEFGNAADLVLQDKLVISQLGFVPAARGVVWDLRQRVEGAFEPLDLTQAPHSNLNSDFILSLDYPDEELTSFLTTGVQFKMDVTLNIVMHPHLKSLQRAFDNAERELLRLESEQYMQFSDTVPFLPIICIPQGTTPRKYEANRDRRTSDASSPRDPIVADDGTVIYSFNHLIGLKTMVPGEDAHSDVDFDFLRWVPDADAPLVDDVALAEEEDPGPEDAVGAGPTLPLVPKWCREQKPTPFHKIRNDQILRSFAKAGFGQVFQMADDYKDAFSQMPLHPIEWPRLSVAWRPLPKRTEGNLDGSLIGDPCAFITEWRVGFGLSASPSIMQRWMNMILWEFENRFQAEEERLFAELEATLLPGDPRLVVIQARRALSEITGKQELKLFSIFGYTDDVTLTCVGHERMLRAVRCWRRLLRDFNVKTAIPRKRGLGSSQEFLGLHFHATAGLVVVPQDKRLRALACLNDILSKARVTFRSYRALMGLLEWLRPVLGMGANAMYGLYGRVFKKGMRAGPSSVMEITERMLEKCGAWKAAMLAGAGNTYAAVASGSVVAPRPTTQIFHLYSDAAIEDNGEGGLGGACHGFVWYYRLRPRDRRLHITALEFLGVALNIIVFVPKLAGATIKIYTDAITVAFVLQRGRSKSEAMSLVHDLLLRLPVYRDFSGVMEVLHTFGESNILADAASRFKMRTIADVAALLGFRPTTVRLPKAAYDFLDEFHRRYDQLMGNEPEGVRVDQDDAVPSEGKHAHPGPSPTVFPGFLSDKKHMPANTTGASSATTSGLSSVFPGFVSGNQLTAGDGRAGAKTLRRETPPPTKRRRLDFSHEPTLVGPAHSSLLAELKADTSPQRLNPKDWALVEHYVEIIDSTTFNGVPENSQKKIALSLRRWKLFCDEVWGSPYLRTDPWDESPAIQRREQLVACSFIIWLGSSGTVKPKSKADKAPKPDSLMAVLTSVRRWHKLKGYKMAPLSGASAMLKGLCVEHLLNNGPESLQPRRKEPLSAQDLRRMRQIPSGMCLRTRVVDWSSTLMLSVWAALCLGLAAAFRKAEMFLPSGSHFDFKRLSWASVVWFIRGKFVVIPTNAQLRGLAEGDAAVVKPGCSKTDPFGTYFSTQPIWLPVVFGDVTNAALALAEVALRLDVPAHARASTSLFCSDSNLTPITHAVADTWLHVLLVLAFGADKAKKHSWHSCRIGAACALRALGFDDASIMAYCRWKSKESLNVYARIGGEQYAETVKRIATADISTIQVHNLPTLDGDAMAASLQGLTLVEVDE